MNYLELLREGDEIWVSIDNEWWAKRIKSITRLPDGSFDLVLESALDDTIEESS